MQLSVSGNHLLGRQGMPEQSVTTGTVSLAGSRHQTTIMLPLTSRSSWAQGILCRQRSAKKPNALAKDLIHDFGAARQGRHDLMPVDQFRRRCLVVPGQQRNRFYRDTASR